MKVEHVFVKMYHDHYSLMTKGLRKDYKLMGGNFSASLEELVKILCYNCPLPNSYRDLRVKNATNIVTLDKSYYMY